MNSHFYKVQQAAVHKSLVFELRKQQQPYSAFKGLIISTVSYHIKE